MSDNNNIQNEIQEENKAENRRQASQDEVIAPFKEISYDYFLANKKLNKKCCSCCCVLKAYQSIDNYINNKIEMEKVFIDQKKLCCFKNVLMINFITLIWDFLLNIPNLYICFHLKPEFKKLKDKKKVLDYWNLMINLMSILINGLTLMDLIYYMQIYSQNLSFGID